MNEDQDLDEVLASLAGDAAARHPGSLTDEEVVAYELGELSPEGVERVLDLLPFDERALGLALDLAAFPESPPAGSPADLSPAQLEEHRRRLAVRLAAAPAGEATERPKLAADVASGDSLLLRRARRATALAIAASVAAILIGLWGVRERSLSYEAWNRLETPGTVHSQELFPLMNPRGDEPGTDGALLPVGPEVYELTLLLPPPTDAGENQRLDAVLLSAAALDRDPIHQFHGIAADSEGKIKLWLPRRAVPPGGYEVRVTPAGTKTGGAVFRFRVPPQVPQHQP